MQVGAQSFGYEQRSSTHWLYKPSVSEGLPIRRKVAWLVLDDG